MLIWGTVLHQPFKMYVDTGAAVIVVSEQFFHIFLLIKYACTQKQLFEIIGHSDYVCDAVIVPNLSYNIVLW